MPNAAIPIGPFTLLSVIGRGGMGEVWRARHASGVEMAVKVLTAEGARRSEYHEALAAEIVAIARLEHPALVAVHDHGLVDGAAEAASGGALRAGSPWMAMELVDGRSLDGAERTLDWVAAARIAGDLLEGLAHAHARGVVHRDVKPANVLLDAEGAVRLGDFGIARLDARAQGSGMATPGYAPPEQTAGEWRDQGPWTDVYAAARLLAALLAPGEAVPADLPGWLARATAAEARARFPSARHAIAALEALGPVAVPWSGAAVPHGARTMFVHDLPEAAPTDTMGPVRAPAVGSWTQRARRDDPLRRVAGLALWGLRPPRLAGRSAERDALRSAFSECVARGPRLVLLGGAPSLGKTRLARAFGEEVHEHVGALVLTMRCEPEDGPAAALGRLVASALGTGGLPPARIPSRVDALMPGLGRRDRDALAALAGADLPSASLDGAFAAVVALLRELSTESGLARPVVIVVEGIAHGPDVLRWVKSLLDGEGEAPLLVVGVLEEGPRSERAMVAIDDVARHAATRVVEILPLDPGPIRALLGDLVDLDEALAARVAAWTGGSPLFAVQILTDWVRRGALEPGPGGFRLRDPDAALPPRLDSLWSDRVAAWSAGASAEERAALEAAAMLGEHLDGTTWEGLCAALDQPPRAVLDRLLLAGLARASPGAAEWWFADPSLRDLVVRTATAAGRGPGVHQLAARALAGGRANAREGRHLLAAGEPLRAVEALLRASTRMKRMAALEQSEALMSDLRDALAQADLPDTDDLRAEALCDLAEHARMFGGPDPLPQLRSAWRSHGSWNPLHAARMAHTIARLEAQRGRREEAAPWLEEARRLAALASRGPHDLGREILHDATLDLADGLRWRGRIDEAEALFARVAAEAVHPVPRGFASIGLADCAFARADLDAAEAAAAEAWRWLEPTAHTTDLVTVLCLRGNVARMRGDLEAAAEHYQRAIALSPGSQISVRANQLNMGILRLLQDRPDDVEAALAWAPAAKAPPFFNGAALLLLAAARAARGDRAGWDELFPEACRVLDASGIVEVDIAIAAAWAADRWGDDPRAADARALAGRHR